MWNMSTYKCNLRIRRLERETFLSCTENPICALKSSTPPKNIFRIGTKIGSIELVETNNFLRLTTHMLALSSTGYIKQAVYDHAGNYITIFHFFCFNVIVSF